MPSTAAAVTMAATQSATCCVAGSVPSHQPRTAVHAASTPPPPPRAPPPFPAGAPAPEAGGPPLVRRGGAGLDERDAVRWALERRGETLRALAVRLGRQQVEAF